MAAIVNLREQEMRYRQNHADSIVKQNVGVFFSLGDLKKNKEKNETGSDRNGFLFFKFRKISRKKKLFEEMVLFLRFFFLPSVELNIINDMNPSMHGIADQIPVKCYLFFFFSFFLSLALHTFA